jgi:hypothetical protein
MSLGDGKNPADNKFRVYKASKSTSYEVKKPVIQNAILKKRVEDLLRQKGKAVEEKPWSLADWTPKTVEEIRATKEKKRLEAETEETEAEKPKRVIKSLDNCQRALKRIRDANAAREAVINSAMVCKAIRYLC